MAVASMINLPVYTTYSAMDSYCELMIITHPDRDHAIGQLKECVAQNQVSAVL